jgi:small-conductance mechanosensitive channel
MNQNRHQQAVNRIAARHLKATSAEGREFVQMVAKALDDLKDAIDISEHRSSDNYETGESLADWNNHVAEANSIIRAFSAKIAPHLRSIR